MPVFQVSAFYLGGLIAKGLNASLPELIRTEKLVRAIKIDLFPVFLQRNAIGSG